MTKANTRRTGTVAAWSFMVAQFVVIGLMLFGPRDKGFSVDGILGIVGTAASIVGGAAAVWSAIYLRKGLTVSPLPNGATGLVSAGPYRWVRHPVYSAVILFMIGVAALSGSWLVVVESVGLVALFNIKARWEEVQLRAALGGYENYAVTTPRFIPNLRRKTPIENGR